MLRVLILALALLAGLGRIHVEAQAQEAGAWPQRPVRIIVPYGAGSTPDLVARLLADAFQEQVPGSTFLIENKPGAGGTLGTEQIARAAPDGTTIGISIGGPLAIAPLLNRNLRYDPVRDLTPISQLITQPSILAVNAATGIDTVAGLLAALRQDATPFTYGSLGAGSVSHLAMESIAEAAGVKIVHLPLQSSPAAVTALLRNDVQIACLPAVAVAAQAEGNRLRLLAVTTPKRSPYLPGLPTLRESGIDVEADAWQGLVGPAGLPPDLVARLHGLTVQALARADVRTKLAAQLMEPVGGSPEQLAAVIAAEAKRWDGVIRKLPGLKAE